MKALGIAAMVIAILSIFVPLGGVYLTLVSALLAAFAGGPGVSFAGAALIINLFNLALLSPSLWITQASAHSTGGTGPGLFLVAAQILAAVILALVHRARMKKTTP
jgi:hypothetical protein